MDDLHVGRLEVISQFFISQDSRKSISRRCPLPLSTDREGVDQLTDNERVVGAGLWRDANRKWPHYAYRLISRKPKRRE